MGSFSQVDGPVAGEWGYADTVKSHATGRLAPSPLPSDWRRRALVLAGVLLVLFLIAQACKVATSGGELSAGGESRRHDPATGQSGQAVLTGHRTSPGGEQQTAGRCGALHR